MNEIIEIQNNEPLDEGYAQISIVDVGWTNEEREAMRERGFDDMDMLGAWFDKSLL